MIFPSLSGGFLDSGADRHSSMEPAFQRGDLLFLWNRNLELNHIVGPHPPAQAEFPGTQVGEIVVYNVKGKDIPIVHRVVRRHKGA